jgi:Cu(I)/Ag(I) efflux system membrane fusion protein
MKIKSILLTVLFAAGTFATLSNCSRKDSTSDSGNAVADGESKISVATSPQFQVSTAFQKQLAEVFSAYVLLKEAFVSSDPANVKLASVSTNVALNGVDGKLVTGAAHNDWTTYHTALQTSLKAIEVATDIEVQRKEFSILSDHLYKVIKAFGLGGTAAYYEFCPMAFNNEGGYWLSDQPKIRNPYFGDRMLTCGSVKETLK